MQVSLYPAQCAPWLLSAENLPVLLEVMQGTTANNNNNGADAAPPGPPPPALMVQLLDVVARCAAVPGAVTAGATGEARTLAGLVAQLAGGATDGGVKAKACEAHALLAALPL